MQHSSKSNWDPPSSITDYSSDQGPSVLVWGFAVIIIIGTLLLSLPIATESGQPIPWHEALFTATSATTVTGLAVVGTAGTFSRFGEVVILILIQVGGVGFMTLSVILLRLIGRQVNLEERRILRQSLGVTASQGAVQLAVSVMIITLAIELVAAVPLYIAWLPRMGPNKAAYYAVFHSISAFCNAGFDLFGGLDDPLLQVSRINPVVIFTLSILIIIGTMGITVIFDLFNFPRTKHLSLHTKLITPLMIALTIIGTLILILDETFFQDVLYQDFNTTGQRWLVAFFTVVSSRTAGITFIPIQELGQASQLLILVYMFIGGAPASMGGGIGLTTVAVVLVTLYSNVRGYPDVRVFERVIPVETVFKASAILTVSITLVLGITMSILLFDGGELFNILFEVVSAFSNTGYSLGISSDLNLFSRFLIVFTMFWGRLGPLTLVVALARRDKQTQIHYPEERIIIG